MTRPRLAPIAALAVLLTLSGCAHPDNPTSPEKIKAAMLRVGGDPDTIRFQTIVARNPNNGVRTTRTLILVPGPDGKTVQIIDSQGEVFSSYGEFLRDNTIPQ